MPKLFLQNIAKKVVESCAKFEVPAIFFKHLQQKKTLGNTDGLVISTEHKTRLSLCLCVQNRRYILSKLEKTNQFN